MANIKKVMLSISLLIVLTLCGTVVMKIFDLIIDLEFENIRVVGFKVGFLAWILLIVGIVIFKTRKHQY